MRNKGFTLIELVIVIVILGILAATAAPKFLDLTGDARASVIKGVQGSVNSAADIVHAKALIKGNTQAAANDNNLLEGTSIAISHGWPRASQAGIGNAVELGTNSDISQAGDSGDWLFTHSGADASKACNVKYEAPVSLQTRPVITANVDC